MLVRFVTALMVLAPAVHDPQARAALRQPTPAATPADQAQPTEASYEIDARLDPSSRTMTGKQLLSWRNGSNRAADSLQFHLYYNAWRNTNSTWMREQRLSGNTAPGSRPESDWGWIDVESVQVTREGSAAVDLTKQLRFISPDDGNPDDRTVAEIPLDTPARPGERLSIAMAWSARVPRTFERTGAIGNYYFIAQWFPKIGVLQDTGWNCHQFHAATEFFADFGTYDVRLTVPRGWIVGATGTERERHDSSGGTTTHRYYQERVHDFAWTTSPDYLDLTASFTHATLPAVTMRLLLQPEHRGQETRHFEAARAALGSYGEWFGSYPYGHITIVDPAWRSGAGGMEYPTLVTAGSRWIAPRGAMQPESVTIHETGHQFWYAVVASNEFEHAWLDEGINTFATARTMAEKFEPNDAVKRYVGGFIPWVFRDLPLRRESRSLAAYRPAAMSGDAQAVPTWKHWPGTAAPITYHKTALWLQTLERMLGWDVLRRILSTYFSRWSFRHPEPKDFFAIANEVAGQDLTWFFDQVYRSSGVFDYGVEVFVSEPAEGRGHVGEGSSRAFVDRPGGRTFRTTVVARRYGEGIFPVDVRVVLENDEEVRWRWDGRDRSKRFEVERPVRARRADVDPDRILLLDLHPTNNSALLEPAGRKAAWKWSLVWLIWLQDHLLTYGFLV